MYPSSSTIWIQPPSFSFRRGSKWNQAATETICLLGQMVFWISTCWLSSKAVSFSSCPRQPINKCVIFRTSFYPFSGQSTWETACHGCLTDFQSSAYFWGCWGDGPLQKWDVPPHEAESSLLSNPLRSSVRRGSPFPSVSLGPLPNVTFLNPSLVSRSWTWFCYTFQWPTFSGRKMFCLLITISCLQFSTKPSAILTENFHPYLRLTLNGGVMSSC